MPACIAPSIPRSTVGKKRRSRSRFGALFNAWDVLFQTLEASERQARKYVNSDDILLMMSIYLMAFHRC